MTATNRSLAAVFVTVCVLALWSLTLSVPASAGEPHAACSCQLA